MKKVIVLFMAFMLLVPSFTFASSEVKNVSSNQEKGYPTAKEIVKMNKALDKMVVKANQKLKNGENQFVLKEKIGDETIELGFKSKNITPISSNYTKTLNTSTLASAPSGSKVYVAYVKNTEGWNFEHVLAGEFSYSGGKVTGATKDVKQSGTFYSESHRTWIDKLDSSVWVVNSHGTFKALKYLAEYNTYISVKLLGSGDYRIERAELGF
jgi:hypothetical protein